MLKGFKKICGRGNRTGKKQNTTEVRLADFSDFCPFIFLVYRNNRFSLQKNPYNFDGYTTMPMDMPPN